MNKLSNCLNIVQKTKQNVGCRVKSLLMGQAVTNYSSHCNDLPKKSQMNGLWSWRSWVILIFDCISRCNGSIIEWLGVVGSTPRFGSNGHFLRC
jgi:hypothetical protein